MFKKNNFIKAFSFLLIAALLLVMMPSGGVTAQTTIEVDLGSHVASSIGADSVSTDAYLGSGSWNSNGNLVEFYLEPDAAPLNMGPITVDDIDSVVYRTKNDTDDGVDWGFYIYTLGDKNGWYEERLISEPIYSLDYDGAPADTWNTWQTDSQPNQMTFYDSHYSAAGFYNGPTLSDIQDGPFDWSDYDDGYDSTSINYGEQVVKYFKFATGSGWSHTFFGLLDAIELTISGTTYIIDLEDLFPVTYVDDNWTGTAFGEDPDGGGPANMYGNDAFDNIQDAIDATAAGGMVNIYPGTYIEEILIDKPLQIIGQGTDTIIQSPDEIEQLFGTSSHPIVLIQDTDDVTIENLVIDGAGKGNANQNFVGVAFSNAGGLLQDLTVEGIIETPFSGAQHGVAVSAYNTDEITRSISLQDNTIVDFQKNAVSIIANETTPVMVDIQGNIITGAGANSVTAQNGIQVSAAQADGTISNNTVTGIGYSGNGWVATSILTTGNIFGELLIDNNTITEAQMGVYVYDGVSMISNNTIEVEKIGDFSYGIIATDPPIAMPDPYGEESLEISVESTDTRALLPVSIVDNNITLAVEENGVDVDTWGILAYGGSTLFDLDLTVTGNIITGFDYGVEIYQAEDETGEIVSVEAHQNCIIDSQFYAMLSNADAITVNAINNFWGDPSGPFHPTLNPDGLGGEVSDDIDFEPWLDVCPLIEQPEVPFEYFLPLVLN